MRATGCSGGSTAAGGRGFKCPSCDEIFKSAEATLAHAKEAHGIEGRETDEEGRSCCLWDGCGKMIKLDMRPKAGESGKFRRVQEHEALHSVGTAPSRGFVCPRKTCDEAFPTSEEAWAHALEQHGVKHDPLRCLWEGCLFVARKKYLKIVYVCPCACE